MDKLQVIEKVYESINIHRALLICTDMNEMQEFHQELLNKDYPVGFDEDNQNNRLLIGTNKSFFDMKNLEELLDTINVILYSSHANMLDSLYDIMSFYKNKSILIICL